MQSRRSLLSNNHNPQEPAEQTRRAVEKAIDSVKTPEQADKVIEHLEQAASGKTEEEVAKEQPAPAAEEAAHSIEQAAKAPESRKAETVITEVAKQLAAAEGEDEEILASGVQQAINPEVSPEVPGVAPPANEEQRRLLQEAALRHLSPLQAADTALFLAINQRVPRNEEINALMYALTTIMNRGDGWVLGLLAATLADPRHGRKVLLDVLPALWLATVTVEVPIKSIFKRRRPFISLVRAIVVGRKPSGFSFPSGHSAAAFAGALLLTKHYPRLAPLFYLIASVTGFSRIYLGAHYPLDVLTGATVGTVLAAVYREAIRRVMKEIGS